MFYLNTHTNKNVSTNWLNNQHNNYYHNQNQQTLKTQKRNSYKYKPEIKQNNSNDKNKDDSLHVAKQLKFERLRLSQKEFSNNLFSKLRRNFNDSSCQSCNK